MLLMHRLARGGLLAEFVMTPERVEREYIDSLRTRDQSAGVVLTSLVKLVVDDCQHLQAYARRFTHDMVEQLWAWLPSCSDQAPESMLACLCDEQGWHELVARQITLSWQAARPGFPAMQAFARDFLEQLAGEALAGRLIGLEQVEMELVIAQMDDIKARCLPHIGD
jgi:hypothetical protein